MKLQIWDTAGQERYRTITNAYYRGADGIFVVFDLTNRESFAHLDDWLKEIRNSAPEDIEIVVFGNKADLEEDIEVTDEEIDAFSKKSGLKVIKCSAKSAENVEKGFLSLTSKLIEKRQNEGGEADTFNQLNDQFFNPAYDRPTNLRSTGFKPA